MTALHRLRRLDRHHARACARRHPDHVAGHQPQRLRVLGVNPQRPGGVGLPPSRVAEDGVRGERAPLARREHEGELGVGGGRAGAQRLLQLLEEVGQREVKLLVTGADALEHVVPPVDREHHARGVGEDRVEERVGHLDRVSGEARARQRRRVLQRRLEREPEQHRAFLLFRGQLKRPVEQHRRLRRQPGVADSLEQRLAVGGASPGHRLAQRPQVLVRHRAERLAQARVDLGLRKGAVGGQQQPRAELKRVLRELEVEEGRLRLLELGRRGQHVVR